MAQPGLGPGPLTPPVVADPGWARGAGVFGIVSMAVIAVGVAAIIAVDETDTSLGIGIPITIYAAVAMPIIAAGGGSARNAPGVTGSSGLRIGGWVAFSLAMLDAMVLLGITAADGDVDPPVTASVGLLGEVAILLMTLDAFKSASQADELALGAQLAERPSLSPFVGLATTDRHDTAPVLGVRGSL